MAGSLDLFYRRVLTLLPNRLTQASIFQIALSWVRYAAAQEDPSLPINLPLQLHLSFDASDDWRTALVEALVSMRANAADASVRGISVVVANNGMDAPSDAFALTALCPDVREVRIVESAPSERLERASAPAPAITDVFARHADVLAWAHATIKAARADAQAIAVDARDFKASLRAGGVLETLTPRMRIWILGDPAELPGDDALDTRVRVLRRTGADLLDEIAMARSVNVLVGRHSHYSILAADAGVPVLSPQAMPDHGIAAFLSGNNPE